MAFVFLTDSVLLFYYEVEAIDFAKRLKKWTRQGYPELGDRVGMGIGRTTAKFVNNPKYIEDPHAVSTIDCVFQKGSHCQISMSRMIFCLLLEILLHHPISNYSNH